MLDFDTIVVGSGCAGFNAADCLYDLGHKNIALITEGVHMGTSRNTGSDKQTYYKLSLASGEPDSVSEMAKTLFEGGGVNGDTALIEAACSVQSFMKLVQLGVKFPKNRYGEYVGYKTDHDPRQRATSCGPLTSKLMVEALERSVKSKDIIIFDDLQVVQLLVENNKIVGLAAISLQTFQYHVFSCRNVILATGGPAGIYYNSVYPESQTGGTGLALSVGAVAANLCEWQYGLASIKFRWNVSGTYQQVLPKYISVDKNGIETEFLPTHFKTPQEALDQVFLKGYQWPFDVRKINTSSQIDMLIHKEINEKGNRVFMDFRSNPKGLENGFSSLCSETLTYLEKSGATFGTPISRLAKMNPKAIELYAANGIDLYNEPLEVAVCAQHANGGIAVDANWESSVSGLFVVGEAAGTFGVYRPGGSALNATQVGSMRAAEHIAYDKKILPLPSKSPSFSPPSVTYSNHSNIVENRLHTQKLMSQHAAYIRDTKHMKAMYDSFCEMHKNFFTQHVIRENYELPHLLKSYDLLTTQIAILSAMLFSAEHVSSRGSALVMENGAIKQPVTTHTDKIIATKNNCSYFESVRPLPQENDWFETVWNDFNTRIQG